MEEFSRKKLNKTMESLQVAECKLEDESRVYMLNYKNPYFLDYMLETGVSNTPVIRYILSPTPTLVPAATRVHASRSCAISSTG